MWTSKKSVAPDGLPGDHDTVTTSEDAASDLQNAAVLWSIHAVNAATVVTAACRALVAGLDTPTLRRLAACFHSEADYDVPELLPAALNELGLIYYPPGSRAGQEAAARALALQHLSGALTPRELASEIHRRFGHSLPLAERLAELDDEYDILEYGSKTPEQIDAEITTEARRLTQP